MVDRTRKTRTPIADLSRTRLGVVGKDPRFEYYIVNDVDGRVESMKGAGWEVVTDSDVKIGDRRVSIPTAEGSAKTVSVGGGVTGVLMKIQKDWWDEDQKAMASQSDQLVAETKRDAKQGNFGDIEIK